MLIRHNPLRELDQLLETFDSLWGPAAMNGTAHVPLDIFERENELCVRASLPGVNPEDVEIAVEGDLLTLRGESKAEWETKDAKVYRRETRYGRFARSVRLPDGYAIDRAEANFDNGVVVIRVPKLELPTPEVKRIPLRKGQAQAIEGRSETPSPES